jgi:hypothetical protein
LARNEVLGGDWWQAIWMSGAEDRVTQIRQGYAERLVKAAGRAWSYFTIHVSDTWQGPSAYDLLFFTQHQDGVWKFHEAVSLAREEHRTFCLRNEGRMELEPLHEREAKWVKHVEQNVERLLATGKPFQPVYKITDVYGDAFGLAREKHLRSALRNLKQQGKLSEVPKGDLGKVWIRP